MYPILNENDYISVMEDLVRMPDGVGLYTRSIVPKGRETYPIVFQRTPYAKALSGVPCSLEEYVENAFVQNGYALVIQHCRGTGDSEGICIPYENEREDGLVTLDQIRKFPFIKERFMFVAAVTWLQCICPILIPILRISKGLH